MLEEVSERVKQDKITVVTCHFSVSGADLPGLHRVANATLKDRLATPGANPVAATNQKKGYV